jgi:hypothetical protein
MRFLAPLVLALLAACGGPDRDTELETDVPVDTDVPTPTIATLSGDITWSVDFGATSEAAGHADCAYTRTYSGVEDRSAPWLCPDCDDLFRADIVLSGRDCYDQVSSDDPAPTEWIGYHDGTWYRAAGSPLTARGAATRDASALTVGQRVESDVSGGDWAFDIAGTLAIGETEGDAQHGFVPPASYACGWPKASPAAYTGDYLTTVGATVPDGVFTDICDEPVRLHDFAGDWFVVDISAMDCPPCQAAASDEEAFVADLGSSGIPVHVVTLMAPSLTDTAGTPTHEQLQQWIDRFELTSPVLADRVWGLSTTGIPLGEDFGYPTFIVVAPDLSVTSTSVGYSSWDDIAAEIRAGQ